MQISNKDIQSEQIRQQIREQLTEELKTILSDEQIQIDWKRKRRLREEKEQGQFV